MGLGASLRTGMPGTPDAELGSAVQVEVVERAGDTTTFALRLPVTVVGDDLSWLGDARVAPGATLGVYVRSSGADACLVRGPVTGQTAHIAHGGAGSHVDVLGADASVALDRMGRTRAWENARDSDAVTAIIGDAGFTPDVTTTPATHRSSLRLLAQSDTDLRFVRRLARRNGYLAWLTTDATTGLDTFHFAPPPVSGSPAATLVINQSGANTEVVDLSWDSERPTGVEVRQLDLLGLSAMDSTDTRPPTTALGKIAYASVVGDRISRVVAPGDDPAEVKARAEGAAVEAEWFVQASLETTLAGLGKVVRAHSIVELKGLGSVHSGKWFVAGVRHLIDPTGHRMFVDLVRNAWGA